MPPFYRLNIVTPQGTPYSAEIIHAMIPAENGFVGVLANHAPYVTSSPGGRFEVREKTGDEKKFIVGAGFFEVIKNQASFFTESFRSNPSSS